MNHSQGPEKRLFCDIILFVLFEKVYQIRLKNTLRTWFWIQIVNSIYIFLKNSIDLTQCAMRLLFSHRIYHLLQSLSRPAKFRRSLFVVNQFPKFHRWCYYYWLQGRRGKIQSVMKISNKFSFVTQMLICEEYLCQ